MLYRKLGRTGLDVGIIGLGAEHLEHEPEEAVRPVVDEAISGGVNYIDLFMPSPGIRDIFGRVLKGRRSRVMIAGHLGATYKDSQYYRTRDREYSEKYFHDLLTRLHTDYIDILMLHFIDTKEEYDTAFGQGSLLELALKLKAEGKVRFLGMSSHRAEASLRAVKSGFIDVLMFPVNPAFDMLPGEVELEELWKENPYRQLEDNEFTPVFGRSELYRECERQGVGIVVMKPYAGGWLFRHENPSSLVLTPAQCLDYSLSRPGVSTVVPGCKTVGQMREALSYLNASADERDYSRIISGSKWRLKGACMYCNHCLPCPVGLDIAAVTRLADSAGHSASGNMRLSYESLGVKASECIECGACMERCPFDVDAVQNMKRAAGLFELRQPD